MNQAKPIRNRASFPAILIGLIFLLFGFVWGVAAELGDERTTALKRMITSRSVTGEAVFGRELFLEKTTNTTVYGAKWGPNGHFLSTYPDPITATSDSQFIPFDAGGHDGHRYWRIFNGLCEVWTNIDSTSLSSMTNDVAAAAYTADRLLTEAMSFGLWSASPKEINWTGINCAARFNDGHSLEAKLSTHEDGTPSQFDVAILESGNRGFVEFSYLPTNVYPHSFAKGYIASGRRTVTVRYTFHRLNVNGAQVSELDFNPEKYMRLNTANTLVFSNADEYYHNGAGLVLLDNGKMKGPARPLHPYSSAMPVRILVIVVFFAPIAIALVWIFRKMILRPKEAQKTKLNKRNQNESSSR